MLRIFWCVWTVLMITRAPSVSTQVCVVCGEPSGINVVMKQGFWPRINSTNRSGRTMDMTILRGDIDLDLTHLPADRGATIP
jgi:hypothetical protein